MLVKTLIYKDNHLAQEGRFWAIKRTLKGH